MNTIRPVIKGLNSYKGMPGNYCKSFFLASFSLVGVGYKVPAMT